MTKMRMEYLECEMDGHSKYYLVVEQGAYTAVAWGRIAGSRVFDLSFLGAKFPALIMKSRSAVMDRTAETKKTRGYSLIWAKTLSAADNWLETYVQHKTGKPSDLFSAMDEVVKGAPEEEEAGVAPKVVPKKKDPKAVEIVLQISKEPKEYIPEEQWFLDTGCLKPIACGIHENKPILLKGDTGCGKTSAIRYLAFVTKNGFRRINMNGGTTVEDFIGKWKVTKEGMVWIDGVLIDAMRKGHWLLVDEANAFLPEIAFAMHSLLDDDRMVLLTAKENEIVRPHPDFRLFAAMNPNYAGTHTLNQAFEDRFPIVVQMEYPEETEEAQIIEKRTAIGDPDLVGKMIAVAKRVRAEYKKERMMATMSTRRLCDWASMTKFFGAAKAFELTTLNKLCAEDKVAMADIAGAIFPDREFRQVLEVE